MQAWEMYFDELRRRADGAERQAFGRHDRIAEAAHEAYRTVADRLTSQHGWSDERTLVVMRGLNGAVKDWLDSDTTDWDRLGRELERREAELREGFDGKPDGVA